MNSLPMAATLLFLVFLIINAKPPRAVNEDPCWSSLTRYMEAQMMHESENLLFSCKGNTLLACVPWIYDIAP
jgi:hypothetical protein